MRIAITGASGRVGRRVADEARSHGHEVVALDRADVSSFDSGVTVDMADYDAVVAAFDGCDAVVHLAGIPGPGIVPDHVVHDNNVVASYHALRGAAEAGIRRVAQASSVNAIGGRFSATPRYDYFPIDEEHPSYAEDAYSLSKWVCEMQADAVARSYPGMSIASLRPHGVLESRAAAEAWDGAKGELAIRHLWGYVTYPAVARAFLQAVETDLGGHEAFYVVAPETIAAEPSPDLAAAHYPDVPIRDGWGEHMGFFDCSKAERLLGWRHDDD
jgi:UDP-glucose 4-epimerase